MPQRILIAGGAGFIGSRLAVTLARQLDQTQIVALDNLTRRGSELNLPRLAEAGVEFVHGDVRCQEDLESPRLEAETIIDCSAEPSVLAGHEAPRRMIEHNLVGTVNLLEAARRWTSRFVLLSTSRVYSIPALVALPLVEQGNHLALAEGRLPPGVSSHGVAESFSLDGHRSLYGATKLAGELLVEEYHQAFGLPTVVNRCGVVAGPGQMARADQGIFALWAAAHVYQRPLAYIGFGGRGLQVRDLIHVDDLVDLIALQLSRFEEIDGETFNVGGGPERALSLLQTTQLCQRLTGHSIPFASKPENRPSDIPWFVTDARRVQEKLSWHPRHSAEQTLSDIVDWIQSHKQTLASVLASS